MKNRFEIRENYVVVFLKRRNGDVLECYVDVEDLAIIHEGYADSWYPWSSKKTPDLIYVKGRVMSKGRKKGIFMHRYLFGMIEYEKGKIIDHKNGNGLDNRRKRNLHQVSHVENNQNCHNARKQSKSGIRNVHWVEKRGFWQVDLCVNKKTVYIGTYNDIEDAKKAAIQARDKYMPYLK